MRYLENPAFLSEKDDNFGNKVSRKAIQDMITKLLQRLTGNEVIEENTTIASRRKQNNTVIEESDTAEHEVEITENIEENQTKEESLNDEYAEFLKGAEKNSEVKTKSKISTQTVDKEMKCFECNGEKTPNLEMLYQALMTIKPTSVESERAFSAMGLFVTKVRNRLNDDTLNAMITMRQHYLAKKKN